MTKIDFVIPWVDGNDPAWRAEKQKYQIDKIAEADNGDCRYRDWDILKYWFRSVEKNAPWVNRIHFVTCGQVPDFLNTEHPKLHMVSHADYIPHQYLPTFSSRCIELNFHRIEGLSEHFVYFNDDMFLNQAVAEDEFFRDGKPCYFFMYRRIRKPSASAGTNESARCRDAETVYRHFGRMDAFRSGPLKVVHPSYGIKTILWNLYMMTRRELVDFMDLHVAVPILKSTMQTVWREEPALMERSSSHRFRDKQDLNQYIFRYWDLARGNFVPHRSSTACYGIAQRSIDSIRREITQGLHALICLNDAEDCDDYEGCKAQIIAAFETRYPERSSFEK